MTYGSPVPERGCGCGLDFCPDCALVDEVIGREFQGAMVKEQQVHAYDRLRVTLQQIADEAFRAGQIDQTPEATERWDAERAERRFLRRALIRLATAARDWPELQDEARAAEHVAGLWTDDVLHHEEYVGGSREAAITAALGEG